MSFKNFIDLNSFDVFVSFTVDAMSTTQPGPSYQAAPSSTTDEVSGETIRMEIKARRRSAKEKYEQLKARLKDAEAELDGLFEELDITRSSPDSPLEQRIVGTRRLINSVKRNFGEAADCFNAGYNVETLGMALASIREVERRFVAVEVWLKGIERETAVRRLNMDEDPTESIVVDTVDEDRLFRMDVGETVAGESGVRDDVVFFEW